MFPRYAFTLERMLALRWNPARDCLVQHAFLCCNSFCEHAKAYFSQDKVETGRSGRCSREKRELTLLEFMRKEMLGKEKMAKISALLINSVVFVICRFVRTAKDPESNCNELWSYWNVFKAQYIPTFLWNSHMCIFFATLFLVPFKLSISDKKLTCSLHFHCGIWISCVRVLTEWIRTTNRKKKKTKKPLQTVTK